MVPVLDQTAPPTPTAPARWADRAGRTLMAIDALATLGALVNGIGLVLASPDPQLLTEAWRTLAYVVFAGMWAIVAFAPRRQGGIWELLLIHKIAFTVFAIVNLGAPDAPMHVIVDGFLVVTTAVAYVLCRGWQAWRPATPPAG
jgi:hypothetical protein